MPGHGYPHDMLTQEAIDRDVLGAPNYGRDG